MTFMSSRKAATAKTTAPKTTAPKATATKTSVRRGGAARGAEKPAPKIAADGTASAEARALAAKIERDLRDGRLDTLTPEAFQALMAALCKSYGAQLEAGAQFLP